MERGQFEATLLETLVEDNKATTVPAEDFHAVSSPRDEDKKVAGVDVLVPARADDVCQPIDALSEVHRLGSEEDLHRARKKEHADYPIAAKSSAR